VPEEIKRDPRTVSLKDKRELLEAYNEILLNFDPRIQTTMASIGDRFATKTFINSTGSCIVQERLDINGRFAAIVREIMPISNIKKLININYNLNHDNLNFRVSELL
jgi:TldD protein